MKKFTFQVPILTDKETVTFVNADKIKSLKGLLPQKEVFNQYIQDQKEMMDNGKEFHTMKIMIGLAKFEDLKKELNGKMPGRKEFDKCIDITVNEIPLIQIMTK